MKSRFPQLKDEWFEQSSPATPSYNCIAWAAGREDAWWWPDPSRTAYWPPEVARSESIEAFFEAFQSLGYTRCDDGHLEAEFEKVAFYARDGMPTHAARQLDDGVWTSKLGRSIDISHTLRGLEGDLYGSVLAFMKRPRSQA